MADRYLVPGGNGNSNSTTNWSASSGGASGASVPELGDHIIFDANSANTPLTINTALTFTDLTIEDYVGDLIINANFSCNGGTILITSQVNISGTNSLRCGANNASGSNCYIDVIPTVIIPIFNTYGISVSQPFYIYLLKDLHVGYLSHSNVGGAYANIMNDFKIFVYGNHSTGGGLNSYRVNFYNTAVEYCGSTPQVISCSNTTMNQFGMSGVFILNSTSTIEFTGQYMPLGFPHSGVNALIYLSGNIIWNDLTIHNGFSNGISHILILDLKGQTIPNLMVQTSLVILHSEVKIDKKLSGITSAGTVNLETDGDPQKLTILKDCEVNLYDCNTSEYIDCSEGLTLMSYLGNHQGINCMLYKRPHELLRTKSTKILI